MAKLTYRDAQGVTRECVLGKRASIGRHPNQTVQLLDRVVSKAHAVIEQVDDGTYLLIDGGSRNGSYINGEVVRGSRTLHPGDRITVGSTDLLFHLEIRTQPVNLTSRVTIHADGLETHIRSRLASLGDERFLPEREVTDGATLRRDYEKLRISHELGQSIGLETNLEVLLNKILEQAFEIFPADRGVILLRSDRTGGMEGASALADGAQLVPMVVRSREGGADLDAENVRISQTIVSAILQEKQAILSSDAMMDSRFSKSHSIVLEQIRSTMTVPLLHEDNVLGIVHLDSKIARGAFTEKDLQILTGFAKQAAMMIEHHSLLQKMREEIQAREHLDRLLSPQLVEEVLSGRLELKKGGELRLVTVMFADIRSFTTISEKMKPQEVVAMLNEYFELMVDIVFKYRGTLDKFIGDEIMAIWGAPLQEADDTERAVRAVVEMQEALCHFNDQRAKRGQTVIHIGAGLNTGEVVAGYMGSTRSMNYTVMGDTVNTAARFCSAAGPGETLIGQDTHARIGHLFHTELLPPTKLKGKLEHVDIYKVLGLRHDS